jgi:Ca-activated chloride channel homolog
MKSQSLEYHLRHTTPPPPDPQARLRARHAALAEFERIHAQTGDVGLATQTSLSGLLRFFRDRKGPASLSRASRNALFGGIATACVVVVAVSTVWLMPPEQRRILPREPVTGAVEPLSERPREADVRSNTTSAAVPPVEAAGKTGEGNPPATIQDEHRQRGKSPRRMARPEPSPAPAQTMSPPPPSADSSAQGDLAEVVIVQSAPARSPQSGAVSPSPVVTIPGGNVANSSTAPAAGETQEVQVTGVHRRSWLGGLFSRKTSAPAVSDPALAVPSESHDKFEHFEINPVKRVADEPVSTFSVDVDTASYSFIRRRLNEGTLPLVDAVRVEEMINYFDYAWPTSESRDEPFKSTVTVSDSPWGKGKKLIHIGIKGYELPGRQRPDVNLVLLLDVSGSMDEPDKLPLAQQSMALLLDTLKPTDTVAIVVYAGAAGQVLAPTPVKDKETILQALNSLRPGGSTAGAEGIRLAYDLAEKNFRKNGVNRILLATDGDFNVGITDRNELKGFVEREREKGVYLSVLGFGEDNYRDDMAQTLAQNGNGVAAYIDTLNEARKVLVQESSASLFTIAKDVKLQVEFNPATVAEYRLVGYETRALNREDFNNDKVDAGDVGSGHTVTAIYEITPVGSNAKLIDERRYGAAERAAADSSGKMGEYGFLRIRYKLPNGSRSRLLEQPIRVDAGVPEALEQDVEFSTAVAGFGQLLHGGRYTGSLSFEDVTHQARAALGEDPYGYRAEFMQLVRQAQAARGR